MHELFSLKMLKAFTSEVASDYREDRNEPSELPKKKVMHFSFSEPKEIALVLLQGSCLSVLPNGGHFLLKQPRETSSKSEYSGKLG